jgi:transcriptional regulator with XRE-family HTH domain
MQAKTITSEHFFGFSPYNAGMAHPGGRPTQRKRNDLGERIAQARERAGLSQYELAEKLGVTQSTVAGWERKVGALRSDTLSKLALALETSADELLGLQQPRQKAPNGRFKRIFQELSQLPRRQQEYVLPYPEDMLSAQKAKRRS